MYHSFKEYLTENLIVPPDIPNTRNFWHGGDLSDLRPSYIPSQKAGRYEFGPGLYLTTHYDTAKKYAKGSRKLYIVTVENGNDIRHSHIDLLDAVKFVTEHAIIAKRKEIIENLQEYNTNGKVPAYIFQNMLVNHGAIKSSKTSLLRQFLIDQGIDYEIVSNAFGWGEDMMVLYNVRKIVKKVIVGVKDKLSTYDFPTEK